MMTTKQVSPLVIQVAKRFTLLLTGCLLVLILTTLTSTPASFIGSTNMAPSLHSYLVKLQRNTDKLARYQSHCAFLSRCLDRNIISKGMTLKFGFDALPKVAFLQKTILDTMSATNSDIVTMCRDTYRSISEAEKLKVQQTLYDIYQSFTYEEFEASRTFYTHKLCILKNKRSNIKSKKFRLLLGQS